MHFNKNLYSLIKKKIIEFYAIIFFGLVAAVFTIGQAYSLSRIINNVFLLHHTIQQVLFLLVLFLIFSLTKGFAIWFQNYFSSHIVVTLKKTLRKKLMDKISSTGLLSLKSERTGEIVNTLINGVDKLEDYFSKFLPQMFLSAFIPMIILFFVFPLDYLSGIIFLVTAPIIPVFMFLIGSIAEKLNQKQWQTLSRMSAYFFDVLQGLPTLKLFNKTKETIKKIDDITNIFRVRTLKVLRVAFLSALVLEIASTISVAIIAVAIGIRLLIGDFNFADALFILIIAPDFYLPLRQLGVSYHSGMEGVAAFERISEILQPEIESPQHNILPTEYEYDGCSPIIFNNISFSYPDRKNKAVDSISFTIEPNKVTAIVGQSGSGKTTIMNILLRLINPAEGEIFIGHQKLSEIEIEQWRKNITWLPQNPHLFNRTLLENIKLSKNDANTNEVIEAARKAKIHDFISSLPNRYNTNVIEAGANFSGGENQRIAFARAYLRNAPIVLIDEPTANLDPIVEEEILNDMYRLFNKKTVLMIAHKLNTIIRADKVIVIRNGKVEAVGTHDELIKKSNYYNNLFPVYQANIC
jgi:ATP-binding cassette subfamily C protein CydD